MAFFSFQGGNMIIVMKDQATEKQIDEVIGWIESVGYKAHPSRGVERTIIGAIGDNRDKSILKYAESLPGVEKTMPILKPYKLASRESHEGDSIVDVGGISIGGPEFVVMAGPCSIESEEQLLESAYVVKKGGAQILRGGAYKPRTSPYSFQGMEEEGLKIAGKGSPADKHAGRYGSCQSRRCRPGGIIRRYAADRRTQRAKFCAAQKGRAFKKTGAVKKGNDDDDR